MLYFDFPVCGSCSGCNEILTQLTVWNHYKTCSAPKEFVEQFKQQTDKLRDSFPHYEQRNYAKLREKT